MRTVVTWILLTALLVSPATSRADAAVARVNPAERVELRNVELATGQTLNGRFINSAGQPLIGAVVTIHLAKDIRKAMMDETGSFSVSGLHGGQCIIVIDDETFACRLWSNGTAPPKSLQSIALVDSTGDDTVIRGQGIRNRLSSLTQSQKIGLGVFVLAGTVLGFALAQDDEDDAS
ncbi:MAG: hypothetical protein GY903_30835 [Fuerstiella sp.]|nr:hypothetical protein [Fuerstiella sp.]MCP4858889.1 hypothetical protein [Fuerstiella sp.]